LLPDVFDNSDAFDSWLGAGAAAASADSDGAEAGHSLLEQLHKARRAVGTEGSVGG
jgi:hypothetical protein